MTTLSVTPMDLAALLCSRVCHDLISPVSAISNGLEVLDDEKDASMREIALDLIRKSAHAAAAKLKFCRLAYGAAGSAGAAIDTGEAEEIARDLLTSEKISIAWSGPRQLMPKNKVKLLLNLCQLAANAIPRGGALNVEIVGEGDAAAFTIAARGAHAKLQAVFADLITGRSDGASVDGQSIQPYYASLVARECGFGIEVVAEPDCLTFFARSAAAAPQASAA